MDGKQFFKKFIKNFILTPVTVVIVGAICIVWGFIAALWPLWCLLIGADILIQIFFVLPNWDKLTLGQQIFTVVHIIIIFLIAGGLKALIFSMFRK